MVRRIGRGLLLLGLFAQACASQVALAQQPYAAEETGISTIDRLLLAERVSHYARAVQDPSAMLVAVRMLSGIEVRATDFGGVVTGRQSLNQEKVGATPLPSMDGYLSEARRMAGGNAGLRAEIAALEAGIKKGVIESDVAKGPLSHSRLLGADQSWTIDVVVEGGKPAIIAAIGDGDADVNIVVFDTSRRLIAQDSAPDYQAVVRWTPATSGRFRVEVRNAGLVGTYLVLLSS